MSPRRDGKLAAKLASKEFIVTAEFLPRVGTTAASLDAAAKALAGRVTSVNVADNLYGVGLSSLAASVALARLGVEPVYQVLTRDRNRLAIQADLLGAQFLGITNVLCLSGYHQTLMGHSESAGVFEIDSVQLVGMVSRMNEEQALADGQRIENGFAMTIGAVANPNLRPLELNMLRLHKKVDAGARFVQTQAVFDIAAFREWLETAEQEGITARAAVLAGVMPLAGADEAKRLTSTYTDLYIPGDVIERIRKAGDAAAQRKEGVRIAIEIAKAVKSLAGVRGVHILSGGAEDTVPEIAAAL